ncbi:Tripartite tricarboxylate transporter family receptor [Hartmannibacter diazotrophicus]|uniref:Tripartite tricarboxylate transporter family receptor n=1 Tax=Hartmannibacter diazotrophicus TaxID=1482074 RepID=A0A2C9D0U9_9HYPH|nr:tripartite tricarboxylate transporter substrate-binding protein [Hartmannibacter diazotrophicus]SON53880.1 Tripartite tricarboxylate transporter family receptor [Hartmannibacter diazotrophicus]
MKIEATITKMTDAAFAKVARRAALPMLLPLAIATATPGMAQDGAACPFFKDKTVELIVPFSAGGGFDTYGRMVAKHMGTHLGAANMIVRNEPGAGGLLATNKTWTAEPDGLRIQLMSASGMMTAELGGAPGVQFKSGEFSWIGRVSGEPDVIVTSPGGPISTPDDLAKISGERKVRIGSSGVGDIDYVEATLETKVFGLNSDVITGFSGAPEVYSSLARGELDLFTSSLSAAMAAKKADSAKLLWVFGKEPLEGMPDVKPIATVVPKEYVSLVNAHSGVVAASRSLAGPPGIPADRLECLRDAFDETMASDELKAESKTLNRPVSPMSGAEIDSMIKDVMNNAPESYVDILKSSYGN